MSCPRPERLLEFVDGRLDAPSEAEVESHIDICGSCRSELAAAVGGHGAEWTLGRYRIDGMLGSGGMGVVYRGWDPSLARPVAVKVVRGGEDDTGLRERLAREAQSLARLNHPNACHVYDVGTDGDEVWIAMELVHGVTLRAWLAGQPARPEVLAVLTGAGHGLAAAHAAGLVHRDVKPENVLVDATGRAVVTDFGLARSAVEGAAATRTSVLAGTPAYMAPEQLEGIAADARTDQYAFAVMGHEALTGARPRPRNTASAALPPGLRAALGRGLADDPADRFPTLLALLGAITRATAPRRRWPYAVAAAFGVAALAGIGLVVFDRPETAPGDPAARIMNPAPTISAQEAPAPPFGAPAPPPAGRATQLAIVPPADAAALDAPRLAHGLPTAAATHRADAGTPRPHPDAAAIASVRPDAEAPAPRTSSGRVAAITEPAPRFGSTKNVGNLRTSRPGTLAHAESVFASGYCVMPGGPVASKTSQPVDWGRVQRVADVVGLYAKNDKRDSWSEMDAHLVEVKGQRRTYIIDTYWGGAINGDLGASVGDTVALCPQNDDDRWQLPGDWRGPVTRVQVAARIGGPPDLQGLRYISWGEINATNADQRWPYASRVLTYSGSGGKLENGRYMMMGWELEIDAHTKNAASPGHGAWIVVEQPRWEPEGKDRTIVVLHAAEIRSHVFPEP